MKSAGVLRKKTMNMDALRRKDRDRHGKGGLRTNDISSPTVTAHTNNKNISSYTRPSRATTNMPMASGPITIDLHRFADENLNATEVVKKMLGDANEENIRGFHKSLVEAKQTVGGDLQRNVYRNYTEFVSISKEIANLDGDVMHLKMYLNEVRGIWDGFLAMSIQSDDISTNDDNEVNQIVLPSRRPSELMSSDMQSVYRAQLTALWENVEGSQRLVKYVVGRHIIREFVNFLELDPDTQQPRQNIHIFLLNDCILIAARKKRSMSTKHRLVAMYLWKLQSIRINDIKNAEGVVIGIRIISGNSAFFYRSDRIEDNAAFLHAYIRLSEEIDEGLLDNSQVGNFRETTKNVNEVKLNANNKGVVNISEEDQIWLEELPDELEVMIALRQFEEAVAYIGKARKILSSYSVNPPPIIKESMDQISKYTDSLGATICNDLGNPLLTKIQFQRYVDWLLRLDKGEKAREVFLATRSLIIKKRIRQLIFEGDTTTYINELALVVFTLIRNTCEWYRDSFKQNAMSSGFVTWVREQTEIYAEIYKRQVFYQNQLSCQVIADCFRSTLEQCSMLRKVGLDLKFLLEDLFLENIKETVLAHEKKIGVKVDKLAQNDDFSTVSSQNLGSDVKVTSSVVSFYNLLVKFVNEICLLAKLPLYNTVIESVSRLTEHYLRSMLNESQKRDLSKDQRAAALMNVSFVLDNVIPRVSSQLNYHFDRSIPELDSLRARLRELTYRK